VKNLRRLILYRTPVTDAGLTRLEALTGLDELYVNYSPVTDVGVRKLQEAMPRLSIIR
jgi:hypothetical protein